MEVGIAFVGFEVRRERVRAGNLATSIPDTLRCPSANVPELAGGESQRIEVVTHLRIVADAGAVGARNDLIRHTYPISLHCLYTDPRRVKVNVEYPAMPASTVAYYHVGFIPALKGGAFSSNFP
jgi:hypothetical protein